MKISVIIPAYNAEKTLCMCLDSIIKQSYKNIEIIVINDGSHDNTLSICNNYSNMDNRIKVINNSNHGVSYSRNKGIEVASGDYITFVDSDDTLDSDCFEKISKELSKDIDVFRYNFRVIGGRAFNNKLYDLNNKKIVISKETKNELYKHFLTFEEPIPNLVMLLVIKKQIAKKLAFDESLYMMEDANFYVDMFSKINSIYFSNMKLYNYYVNENSATHSKKNNERNILGILSTNSVILSKISNDISKDLVERINSNHSRIISQLLINQYKYSKKEYKIIFTELKEDKRFIEMTKHHKFGPIKNRILLFLINKKIYKLMYLYLEIIKITYKFLGK